MYVVAQPDFLKSETNGGIKNIISYHLKIIKRCAFSPNLEGVGKKSACHALENFEMVKGVAASFFKLNSSNFVKS